MGDRSQSPAQWGARTNLGDSRHVTVWRLGHGRLLGLIGTRSATPMIAGATPAPSGGASAPRAASRPSSRSSTGAYGRGSPGAGSQHTAPARGAASGSTSWMPCGRSDVSLLRNVETHDKDAVQTRHEQVVVQLPSLVHALLGSSLHQRVQQAEVDRLSLVSPGFTQLTA